MGFEPVHRVAQSYLGTLWIALDKRSDPAGIPALLRRLQLPEGTEARARQGIVAAGHHATRLRHENVLSVLGVLEQGTSIAVAYDHLEAEPLRSLQSWANLRCLSFPVGVTLRIVSDLLRGLEAMHFTYAGEPAQSVFGGLSPDSVLVSREGETRLCDPLVASCASLLEGVGFNTAKLSYAAPEQVHAVAALTPQCDLFTVGAMLWELLATRRFLAGSRAAIERKLLEHDLPSLAANLRGDQQVTPELIAVVEGSLAADPARRPSSARAMCQELERAGHELASREEVAHFIGKLSGQRFDRRTAAVRSKSLPTLDSPLEWPIEVPPRANRARRGAQPKASEGNARGADDFDEPESAGARVEAEPSTPSSRRRAETVEGPRERVATEAVPTPSAGRRAPERDAAPATPPSARTPNPALAGTLIAPARMPPPPAPPSATTATPNPALWNTVIAPAVPSPVISVAPARASRTMTGLGAPARPALPGSNPFVNATPPFAPAHSAAPPPPAPFATAAPAPQTEEPGAAPLSAASKLLMGQPPASSGRGAAPSTTRAGWTWARGLVPARAVHRLAWAGLFLLTFALSSILFVIFLTRGGGTGRSALDAEEARLPPVSPAAPSSTNVPVPSVAAPPSAAPPQRAERAPTSAPAPAKALPPSPATSPSPAGGDFDAATLDDPQLVQLFALEDRKEMPTCSERLGDSSAQYTGTDPAQSVQQLKAARRELMRGKPEAAHLFLCGATAHDPKHVAAQQGLAELLLQMGDPAQAKLAAERALEQAPNDANVIALQGDTLALLGDLPNSRRLWLSTLPERGSEQDRVRRLASSYRLLGDRALRASGFAHARSFYRRSVILTSGSFAPSIGLSEALLWLGHRRAALVWAERAARAFPKDSRVQVLYGDALYDNERPEQARSAWQAALDAQPGNVTAARRLIEGRR